MRPVNPASVETQTAFVVNDPTDPHAADAPPASRLANRVATAPSAPPRLGVLQRIGRAIKNTLGSIFCVRRTPPARTSGPEQRQSAFAQSLHEVRDALLSPQATSQTIRDTLLVAGATACRLQKGDGSPRELIQRTFQQLLGDASPAELNRLAIALGNATVSNAQELVAHDANAVQILTGLETAVNAELERRVDANIEREIDAALDVMKSGGSPARVADHLHLAFAAASPLVKYGVQSLSDGASRESDAAIDLAMLNHLEHTGGDAARLLTYLSHKDLARLATAAGKANTLEGSALAQEIAERPRRLSADLRERVATFQKNYRPDSKVDRNAFLRDLSAATGTIKALGAHLLAFRAQLPALEHKELDAQLAGMKTEIARAVEATVLSGNVALADLSQDSLRELASAYTSLGSPSQQLSTQLVETQKNEIRARAEDLHRSLTKLSGVLASEHKPDALLDALSETAHASRALDDTRRTFNAAARKMEPALQTDHVYMQWLDTLSEQDSQALSVALAGPNGKPLKDDLDEAEALARKQQNVGLADELKHQGIALMRLQSYVQQKTGGRPVGSEAAPPVASEPMRQALNRRYGLKISAERTVLNAGHFNADQTLTAASILEAPPSDNEAKLDKLGPHAVSHQFLADARRGSKIAIADTAAGPGGPKPSGTRAGTPLVDHEHWPAHSEDPDYSQRDTRIAAGFERLIAFCDGDEEQARTLTLYLHQMLPAGVVRACAGADSPLQLDDGTAGWMMEGDRDSKQNGARVDIGIVLSKGDNGRPQIDVTYRYEGRHALAPIDGSKPIHLSPDSNVEISFRAELDNGALKLMATPSYHFALKADDFQKSYPPPTSALLREAIATEDSLTETLTYCQARGQDYQITALRAADTFRNQPTVANAMAVISECDRAGEKGGSLVSPDIRHKVEAAARDRRHGILAALEGARKEARIVMKAADSSPAGRQDFANAEQFLERLDQLDRKTGPALLEDAEQLYREFIEPATEGSGQLGDRHTLPVDREIADETRKLLAAQRQAAMQPALSADLFDTVIGTLSRSLDTEVLPGMVEAVKRGEI